MINEPETKILFAIYQLYKSEQITAQQRGELKDMLISGDEQIMKCELPFGLLSLCRDNDTQSQSSQTTYKSMRPGKLSIRVPYREQLKDISHTLNSQSLNHEVHIRLFKKKL